MIDHRTNNQYSNNPLCWLLVFHCFFADHTRLVRCQVENTKIRLDSKATPLPRLSRADVILRVQNSGFRRTYTKRGRVISQPARHLSCLRKDVAQRNDAAPSRLKIQQTKTVSRRCAPTDRRNRQPTPSEDKMSRARL